MMTLSQMRDTLNRLIETHGPSATLGILDPTVEGLAFTDAITAVIGRQESGGAMILLMPHAELMMIEQEDGTRVPLAEVGELHLYR